MSQQPPPGHVQRQTTALVEEFLTSSATAIHERLGAVAGIAVSTREGRAPRTLGASTELAADVDRIQFDIGSGPCLQAMESGEGLYVPDLAADPRWGAYGPRAAERGARSCLSVPMLLHGAPVAVFKVYSAERDGLDQAQRDTAEVVARELTGGVGLAAHLTSRATDLDDMTALMTHRRVIDLALGVLMERAQVPADAAFGLLRTQSQHTNRKLQDVAAEVVFSIPGTGVDDLVPHFNPQD